MQEKNRWITAKKSEGKLPLLGGKLKRVIPIYALWTTPQI